MAPRLLTIECALVLVLIGVPWSASCGSDDAEPGDDAADSGNPFGNAEEDGGAPRAGAGGARGTAGAAAGRGGRGGAGAAGTGGREPAMDGGAAGNPAAGEGGAGGASGSGRGGSSGGGGTAGGAGTVPIGAACANDGNCDQSMGATVCCINECLIADQCPDSPGYLPCNSASDCAAFGGAKICCELGPQRFCTKQSACRGQPLP